MDLLDVRLLISHITFTCLEKEFSFIVSNDLTYNTERVFIQVRYNSKCNKTGEKETWKGRKWYLSEYMTEDEVVKTAYTACETAVKHEIMEGFKFDDIIVFNPHVNFRELLSISHKEIKRQ